MERFVIVHALLTNCRIQTCENFLKKKLYDKEERQHDETRCSSKASER